LKTKKLVPKKLKIWPIAEAEDDVKAMIEGKQEPYQFSPNSSKWA